MTEKLLRDALQEAQAKDQQGLLIWANWVVWYDSGYIMKPGNRKYAYVLSKISEEKESAIRLPWNNLSVPGFMAVPVQKLSTDEKYFNHVLDVCEKKHYNGPITFFPSNNICSFS